jgi:hypothetical protein
MKFRAWCLVLLSLAAFQIAGAQSSSVKLQIEADDLVNGVPERITFVFSNFGDFEVKIPLLSPCIGRETGRVVLMLKFTPLDPQGTGVGGGCGGEIDHPPPIFEQARTWKVIPPHSSYKISYKRSELFVTEERPGVYEFRGEYRPPPLTGNDTLTLEEAKVEYLRQTLVSEPLRFSRPSPKK